MTATLTSAVLELESSRGVTATVDLASLQDGTGSDDQTLSLSGNSLAIEDGNSVDLSPYLDNTDSQTLTLSGTDLSISDGNSVDLASLQDGTGSDDQTLSLAGTTLSIEDGNSVNLAALQDGVDDADNDPANELNTGAALVDATLVITDAGGAVTADLSSLVASDIWSLLGNTGTAYPTHFLGTTDNVSVTLKVNNTVAMRYAPGANGITPNLIGGYSGNVISDTVSGGTIAGGGAVGEINRATANYATVGGGANNLASGIDATVSGGFNNQAIDHRATVGGGNGNTASDYATVAGGNGNTASHYATVAGGSTNTASDWATVGGGANNQAIGMDAKIGRASCRERV